MTTESKSQSYWLVIILDIVIIAVYTNTINLDRLNYCSRMWVVFG